MNISQYVQRDWKLSILGIRKTFKNLSREKGRVVRRLGSITDSAVVKKAISRLIGIEKRAIKGSVSVMVHRVREIKLLCFSGCGGFIGVSSWLAAIVFESRRKVRVKLSWHGLVKSVVVVSATNMAVKAIVVTVSVV